MFQSIKNYFSGAVRELHNVTWPTHRQAITITTGVIIFVLICSLFIGGVDFLFWEAGKVIFFKAN